MKILGSILLACLLAGCESTRYVLQYGDMPCVGIGETQDPRFHYKLSVRNTVIGILFFEMIVPPIIILANETFCPVSVKE